MRAWDGESSVSPSDRAQAQRKARREAKDGQAGGWAAGATLAPGMGDRPHLLRNVGEHRA